MSLRVLREPCATCPFKGRFYLRPGRLRSIMEECERENRYFICHDQAYAEPRIPRRDQAVCAGWIEAARRRRFGPPAIIQIAERLGVMVEVEA